MLIPITNDPRPYPWGSSSAIAQLLDRPASGGPEAELWLGAHPGCPARILEPALTGGCEDLAAWIQHHPEQALGAHLAVGARLPFLLKVLAAAAPLSLQAHPTAEQAVEGFRREDEAGVPVDAPHRNYRDAFHKPEMILALSETFDALCGFRPTFEVKAILKALRRLDATDPASEPELVAALATRLHGPDPLRTAVAWLLGGAPEVEPLVAQVVQLAARVPEGSDPVAAAFQTVRELAVEYPGDPGIVVALLVRRVTLRRGEALALPAGNIHAYLSGLGIELMASSDNVLRGGLTTKHIDVPELLDVLDFTPLPVPLLVPEEPAPGVRVFRPDVPDFMLTELTLDDTAVGLPLCGPAIVLATSGEARLEGRAGSTTVGRGGAVYATPDEGCLLIRGRGQLFVATTGEGGGQPSPTTSAS